MAVGKSILWGVLGGLTGGVVTLLFFYSAPYAHLVFTDLTVVNPLSKIARITDAIFRTGDELIWGYVGHFIVSILYGIIFGLFKAIVKPKTWKMDLLIGIFFGFIYTLIGPFLIMPILINLPQTIFNFSSIQFDILEVSIHLAFSLPMALVFRLKQNLNKQ